MNKLDEIFQKTDEAIMKANSDWDSKNDWFYEGNISRTLVEYLKSHSYECIQDNSYNIHNHGEDIIVSKDGIKEIIEVKGYPSDKYVKGEKEGLFKPTKPTLQASHWFASCLHSTLSNYEKHKDKGYFFQLAMCFPDDAKGDYRKLVDKIKPFFSDGNLGVKVYFVDKKGQISIDNLNTNLNRNGR